MIKAFKMKLYEGQEAEYERRHNLLWPEMAEKIILFFWIRKHLHYLDI